jgi:citrate synthase
MIQKGLKGIVAVETAISFIDGQNGILVYRGHSAKNLALQYTFEDIAYLLWHGHLPNESERLSLLQELQKNRILPLHVYEIIKTLPLGMDIMNQILTAVSSLGTKEFEQKPSVEQAIRLTSAVPVIVAAVYRKEMGLPIVQPRMDLTHVENYLYMLTGNVPAPAHVKPLEAYMILTMEHGMNASTFAARVISSTESDMVSAISGAIGAMKGPLHGGAPTAVIDMLDEIANEGDIEGWLRQKLEQNRRIMGFGHRVYKTRDPRAEALKEITAHVSQNDESLCLAADVEKMAVKLLAEYKPGRNLYTNVEFYAAAVMRAINMDPILFTPTFTASRTVGWTSHILEQMENNTIFRPESKYIGTFV